MNRLLVTYAIMFQAVWCAILAYESWFTWLTPIGIVAAFGWTALAFSFAAERRNAST